MRILVAAAVVIVIVMLGSASAKAQSLEKTYADLCSEAAAAKSESCVALSEALVAKLRGQEKSLSSDSKSRETASEATDPIWGPLALLANTAWAVETPGLNIIDRFTWEEDGAAVRYIGQLTGAAYATTEIIFRPGPEPGILSAVVQYLGNKSEVLFRFNEGVLVSDFYFTDIKSPYGPTTHRHEFSLTDGQYLARKATDLTGGRPDFPHFYGQFKRHSDDGIAQLTAQGQEKAAMIDRMVKAKDAADAQAAKAAKAERRAERAAVFGAVMQGVAQGVAEIDTGGYAEAQTNLDATVANINAAAAMERQQQALAAQQEQARAAEQQRQQLAENARWVAEKEQAAAEYRLAQVEAAAAREEARVLAADAEAAAERARRAEAQRQQTAADVRGSVVDKRPPASTGTSLLGGPKESGRGGSSCNEELVCRKTCAGDVVAVTACVKQCARESACRVGIQ